MTTVTSSQAELTRPAKRHRTRNTGRKDDGRAVDLVEEAKGVKRFRRGGNGGSNGEYSEGLNGILAVGSDLNAISAATSPDGTARNPEKETQSIGEDGSHTKRAFNGVLHNRLVSQRRKIDELRLSSREKDKIINQYQTMWAKEKDKNQLLLNRLHEIEKKLGAMTRPLQWSIKSMTSADSNLKKLTITATSEHAAVIGH